MSMTRNIAKFLSYNNSFIFTQCVHIIGLKIQEKCIHDNMIELNFSYFTKENILKKKKHGLCCQKNMDFNTLDRYHMFYNTLDM